MNEIINKTYIVMDEDIIIYNLIYFYILIHPAVTTKRVYKYWDKDKVLSEYPKPEEKEFEKVVTAVKIEIGII